MTSYHDRLTDQNFSLEQEVADLSRERSELRWRAEAAEAALTKTIAERDALLAREATLEQRECEATGALIDSQALNAKQAAQIDALAAALRGVMDIAGAVTAAPLNGKARGNQIARAARQSQIREAFEAARAALAKVQL